MVRRQYPFHLIEPKWQKQWDVEQTFRAGNPGERLPEGSPFGRRHGLEGRTATVDTLPPKYHVLGMVPHPSGTAPPAGHPDDILKEYGADAFRLHAMFMGPLQESRSWSRQGIGGVSRFLGRVWRWLVDEASETEFEQACAVTEGSGQATLLENVRLGASVRPVPATAAQKKALHACIRKVTEGLEGQRFNTAIAALMVFINEASAWEVRPIEVVRPFLQLLTPFSPHLAEELWHKVHVQEGTAAPSLTNAVWPAFDAALLEGDTWEIPVQVNGKLRDLIRVPAGADAATLETTARSAQRIRLFLEGKTVRQVIVVPRKLVNLVVG